MTPYTLNIEDVSDINILMPLPTFFNCTVCLLQANALEEAFAGEGIPGEIGGFSACTHKLLVRCFISYSL